MPLLTTKLYIPPVRAELVSRPRLIERLNTRLHRKLTLISAPAGFGKTTLLSEWASQRVSESASQRRMLSPNRVGASSGRFFTAETAEHAEKTNEISVGSAYSAVDQGHQHESSRLPKGETTHESNE